MSLRVVDRGVNHSQWQTILTFEQHEPSVLTFLFTKPSESLQIWLNVERVTALL